MFDFDKVRQWWIAGQFRVKDRFEFYEMLTLLLDNGVILKVAVEKLYGVFSEEGKKPRNIIAMVCQDCLMGINDGKAISDVLFNWVSFDEYSLIQAGEKSGNLQASFRKAKMVIESKEGDDGGLDYDTLSLFSFPYVSLSVAEGCNRFGAKTRPWFKSGDVERGSTSAQTSGRSGDKLWFCLSHWYSGFRGRYHRQLASFARESALLS
ncbi:hypothetical protein ACFQAT_28980 [Undibacterium arcticum]|uniref:hypothetical protein n=1 Tax=Undibacterium arcticum TaxID=1762892 RepID=UPI003608622D